MKKYYFIILSVLLVFSFASCNKIEEEASSSKITELRFDIQIENASVPNTKAVKTAWATGDKVYVFFKVGETHLDAAKYVTLTYDEGSGEWTPTPSDALDGHVDDLGTAGTLYGIYFPFGNITIASDDAGGVTFLDNGEPVYTYYMTGDAAYTITTSGTIGTLTCDPKLSLSIPDDYVWFFIDKSDTDYCTDGKYRLSAEGVKPVACSGFASGVFSEMSLQVGDAILGYTYDVAGVAFTGKIDSTWDESSPSYNTNHSFLLFDGLSVKSTTFSGKNLDVSSHKHPSINLNVSSWPSADLKWGTAELYVTLDSYESTVFAPAAEEKPLITVTLKDDESNKIDITAFCSISWESDNESVATVDDSGTITPKGGLGRAVVTVTATYAGMSETNYFVLIVTKSGSFRGYYISSGLLKRTDDGESVTYGVSSSADMIAVVNNLDELNQLTEDYDKYSYVNKYFHNWPTLFNELGSDGDNIKSNSDKLPIYEGSSRWTFPTRVDWITIVLGLVAETKVNDTPIEYGYALVTLSGTPGLLLIPDGSDIQLSIDADAFGNDYCDFSENPLTETYDEIVGKGCVFLPCMGEYDYSEIGYGNNPWREGPTDSPVGYYWASNLKGGQRSALSFEDADVAVRQGAIGDNIYYPIRLVIKATP